MCSLTISTTMKLLSALMIIGVLSKAESRRLENGKSRIVYGELVDIKDYPYMVRVYPGIYTCGGALITAQMVLTAAHCVFNGRSGELFPVQDVMVHIVITGERIIPSTIIPHEEFKPWINDIAVIHLESRSSYNYDLPIVNNQKYLQNPGSTFEVIGYGRTENGKPSDDLRGTELMISSQQTPFSHVFHASSETSSSCKGDSGGPAIVRSGLEHILVGVVSSGTVIGETCPVNVPQTFTSVYDFHDWITHKMMMMNYN